VRPFVGVIDMRYTANLPQELMEKIFEYCDWNSLENCRNFQSEHFKKKTKSKHLVDAVKDDNIDNLEWILSRPDENVLDELWEGKDYFLEHASDSMLNYLINNYLTLDTDDVVDLASYGRFEIMHFVLKFCNCPVEDIMNGYIEYAHESGDVSCLYNFPFKFEFNHNMFNTTLIHDDVNIFKWLQSNDRNFSFTRSDMYFCLQFGSVNILRYLFDNNTITLSSLYISPLTYSQNSIKFIIEKTHPKCPYDYLEKAYKRNEISYKKFYDRTMKFLEIQNRKVDAELQKKLNEQFVYIGVDNLFK
jgi:hypothetical protein